MRIIDKSLLDFVLQEEFYQGRKTNYLADIPVRVFSNIKDMRRKYVDRSIYDVVVMFSSFKIELILF